MSMLLRHAAIRLRVALTDPFGVALVLFSGLVTIIFWPGLTNATGTGWPGTEVLGTRGPVFSLTIVLLWLVMWPMIAGSPFRGKSVAGRRSPAFAVHAHPALPVGPRTRALAEALVIVVAVLLLRAPVLFFDLFGEIQQLLGNAGPSDSWREWYLLQSVAGAIVMLPFLLLANRAASSMEAYWLRSILLAGALYGAMKLGWLETFPLCLATSLALATCVLLLPDWKAHGRAISGPLLPAAPRARPARPPESRFRRDLWMRALPVIGGFVAAEALFIVIDRTIELPELAFYFASVFVFSLLLAFVPLQPLRSKMAMAGIFCKPGFEPGDFAIAAGVLPLRRKVVAREVFGFAFVTTAGIWLLATGTIVLSAWLDIGTFGLIDSDGDPLGRLLIPSLAFVPAVAALVTSAVFGDRKGSLVSGGLLLLLPQIGLLMLVFKASSVWVGLVTVLFAVLALLPAVKHLRA